jgi:hypothetical protein
MHAATTIYVIKEERTGTIAEFMEVFVTRKGEANGRP